jgi:hypothetical protein
MELGRKPMLSFAEVLTIFIAFFLSRRKDFKAFYFGLSGLVLREIFPKMTSYSALLRRLTRVGEILANFLQSGSGGGFFIIDSTSFKLCESLL